MDISRDPIKVNQMRFAKVSRTAATISEVKKAQKFKRDMRHYDKAGRPLQKWMVVAASLCAATILIVTTVVLASGINVSQADTQYVPEHIYSYDLHAVPFAPPQAPAELESLQPAASQYEAPGDLTNLNSVSRLYHEQPDIETFVLDAYYESPQEYPEQYTQFEEYIHPGTYSELVFELQQRLIDLSFLELENPTSFFGTASQYAISAFQRQHGIYATGIASPRTLNLLFSSEAQIRSYGEGEASWIVSALQARLAVLGYGVSVTGVFDAATVGAVMHFQTLNGLDVTGRIGADDEKAIFYDSPVHADGVAHNIEDTKYNAEFSAELLIDTALQFLGYRYTWGGKSPATGFDCSGFVYYSLNRSGFEIAYMTDRGWFNTTEFTIISEKSDIQPGDILIYRGHVGIYIGGGLMVDSSFSTGRVRITDINQNFWHGAWQGARRLV